uniref:Protein kinase domain-containing protein n=1 Tax=Strongyloides venezuelensis TaxID=75913 RepID=A0A0K0G1M4_STRVS
MTSTNGDEEYTPEIPKSLPKKIKITNNNRELSVQLDLVLRNGAFHQYIGGDDQTNSKPIDVKTISANGLKVINDVEDTLVKKENFKNFLRKTKFIEFSPSLNCNVIIYNTYMMSLYKYKQIYKYLPKSNEQYTYFEKMLSALEFLHNNGYIHGFLNLTSYNISLINTEKKIVGNILISDLDLLTRSKKDKSFDKLGKNNGGLKAIYEKRLQRSYNNTPFCALKQYTGDKISMKNDIESWYYLCIFLMEDIPDWERIIENEDKMFVMKQSMRQPTYSTYNRTCIRFTEILQLLDKMNNETLDYKLIKKKIIVATKRFEENESKLKNDSLSDASDFVKLANISRTRKKSFIQESLELLQKEIEKDELKNKNDLPNGKNETEKKENEKRGKDNEKKGKETKTIKKSNTQIEVTGSMVREPIELEKTTYNQKVTSENDTTTKKKNIRSVEYLAEMNKKVASTNNETKSVFQEKKSPEISNFISSVKKKFKTLYKKTPAK